MVTFQNPTVRYDEHIAQFIYIVGKSSWVGNPITVANVTPLSQLNMFNSSSIDLLNHQLALQKETTAIISILSNLHAQHNK